MTAIEEKLDQLKKTYEYVIVRATGIDQVKPVQKILEDKGLEVRTQKETLEKLNSVSLVLSLVFGTFGLIILMISAISIFNILSMSVNEEKVDIGILRSVGARMLHIRLIYMLKAGLIGLIGSVDGILIGYIVMGIGNRVLLNYFRDYPFTPESFFAPTWQLVLICFFVGFFFSIVAGIGPTNHAARLKPAIVLRQG
jgi:lipoprotein-releasing system permease protein